jgi:exopolysaccharide biosynthesis protein
LDKNKALRKMVPKVLISAMIFNLIIPGDCNAVVSSRISSVTLNSQNISNNILYKENQISYYEASKGRNEKQRVNVIQADLNNKDVDIILSKPNDKALGMANLTNHIAEEVGKGNRVVGGINGDFFNTIIGISVGPQVRNEEVIVGYTSAYDEKKYPVFYIDKNKEASIDNLHFEGELSVLSSDENKTQSEDNTSHNEDEILNDIIDDSENNSDILDDIIDDSENNSDILDDIIDDSQNNSDNKSNNKAEQRNIDQIKKTIKVDSINRYDEFQVNKYKPKNQMMILTPNYNSTGVIKGSAYAPSEVFVIITGVKGEVENFNGALKLGREYEGVVQNVGQDLSHLTIPKNGVAVLCNGSKAQWVLDNIKKGDNVQFKADFNKKDIHKALSGYTYLVKDGKALTGNEMINSGAQSSIVNSKKPRTALGITSDNKVIAVVVEGGQAVSEISKGVTLEEMAKIMEDLGAVTAMNLDGGGSTQMNVKKYAQEYKEIVNIPTDGRERSLSNAVLFVNNSPKSNVVGSMKINDSVIIYKNSSYKFKLLGEDVNCYPYDFSNKNVKWSVDGEVGKINSRGVFTAGNNSGVGNIEAEIDGVKASVPVRVVNDISDFGVNCSGTLYLNNNDTFKFETDARTNNGQHIVLDDTAVKWSVQGDIGSIDSKGLLKITANKGSGTVTAEAGGNKVIVKIEVGAESRIIDNFENESLFKVNGFVGGSGEVSQEQAWNGNQSYKVTYDYDDKWTREYNGTINVVPTGNENKYISYTRPEKFGIRVYGDGKAPWLRAQFTDGNGQIFTLDMVNRIEWKDKWRNIYADIPKDVVLPIKLNYIYMVETNKELHYKGEVYFDDLRFVYTDNEDLAQEKLTTKITSIYPKNGQVVNSKQSAIKANIHDEMCEIDPSSIEITIDGKNSTSYFDETTGDVYAVPKFELNNGVHELIINAKNKEGKPARRVKVRYTVKTK